MENFDYDLRSMQEARNLLKKGQIAAKLISSYDEKQIDKILRNMVEAGQRHALELAELACEETGFGKPLDKAYKNYAASKLLYGEIKDIKTIGVLGIDEERKTLDVAQPVGLLMGIVPSTNPTSTAIFKSIISIKSRNAIIFSPHPSALKCTLRAAEIMRDAAVEAGAPPDIISCVSMPTLETTQMMMKSKEVELIIATGGPGMVKAAYSAGKPAIGVGAGNAPAYIEKTANVKEAVRKIIASKTFDNGTICASEQSVVCETSNRDEVIREFTEQGGYFMSEEETEKVCKLLFKANHAMNAKFVGRDAKYIARKAGITVPENTKVLLGHQKGAGDGYPLSFEKLTTVLGFYVVNDWVEACELSMQLLQNGIGHTMSLHTNDAETVMKFSVKPASRILVNTGSAQGGTGLSTGLLTSFTLGCGTNGGSSVSENVSPKHLINIKKIAYEVKDVLTLADDPEFQKIISAKKSMPTPAQNFSYNDDSRCCASAMPPVYHPDVVAKVENKKNDVFNFSPDQIAKAFEKVSPCSSCSEKDSSSNDMKIREEIMKLVESIRK